MFSDLSPTLIAAAVLGGYLIGSIPFGVLVMRAAGVAVACLKDGLSQSNFYSAQLHDMVAYHDFEGITIHAEEGPRVLQSIGRKPAVILRNHGLLSWGQTLEQTFAILWTLQRACEIQLASDAGAGPNRRIAPEILRGVPASRVAGSEAVHRQIFEAMLRKAHAELLQRP